MNRSFKAKGKISASTRGLEHTTNLFLFSIDLFRPEYVTIESESFR